MSDIKAIFTSSDDASKKWSSDELLQYIKHTLPPEKRVLLEQQMLEDPFLNDAIEGMQQYKTEQIMQQAVFTINTNIKDRLDEKKRLQKKRSFKDLPWIALTILVVIGLCVAGFFIIQQYLKYMHKP